MEILDKFSSMFSGLLAGVGTVVKAAVILAVAFLVAMLVKSMVVKFLGKGKIGQVLSKMDQEGAKPGSTVDFIGKLVHLLVFLLFVPSIFSTLGLQQVTAPLTNVLNIIWGYVPNIAAAVIILMVGFFIAKLVRQLLVPVFDKLNINKLQAKAGIEVTNSAKLSYTLAYIVYVMILIPTIVMALDALNISVISNPAVSMLNKIFGFIPNIFVALVIIIIGSMIAKFVGQIVTRLIASAGLDAKVSKLMEGATQNVVLSKLIGTIVHVVVIILFVVEGINVLQLDVLTNMGALIIGYMPAVLSAAVILVLCFYASSMAEKALKKNGFATYAVIAKYAILVVGAFMVLSQLGIAAEIVNTAFKLLLAALAVAFAIAFGVGGKEFASNTLKKLEDNVDKKDEK